MDRFASISTFVGVVESGGFSAAARRLKMSPPMVSSHVQVLEEALGVRLLNRTTRHVSLTEIGRDYYERCSRILQELSEADAAASALQLAPRGQLRAFCHQGLAGLIAPIMTNFLARFPEVSIDMRTGDLTVDLVKEGFDLAITPHRPIDTTLVQRRLATWRLTPFCARTYLEKHPAPQHPSDLAEHNCLRYAHADFGDEWSFIDRAGKTETVRVNSTLVTTSLDLLRSSAVSGLGIWLIVPFAVADLISSGCLVPLLENYKGPELNILALYPHRRHMTAKLRAVLDVLVEEFAKEPRLQGSPSRQLPTLSAA